MTFPSDEKLMKISELSDWLSVSRSTIYKWVSNSDFPKPIILGETDGAKNTASRWVEQEVRDWLNERPRGKHLEE
jgi:prophage regulatory protein